MSARLSLPDRTLVRNLLITAALAGLLLVVSLALSPFNCLRLASIAYYFTALAGLTYLTGLNGQISLGHGALMAVGAYTVAILVGRTGWPLAGALAAATASAAFVGALLGVVAGRASRASPTATRTPSAARTA
jgi:branched-chain amino acid transport system permease protein